MRLRALLLPPVCFSHAWADLDIVVVTDTLSVDLVLVSVFRSILSFALCVVMTNESLSLSLSVSAS